MGSVAHAGSPATHDVHHRSTLCRTTRGPAPRIQALTPASYHPLRSAVLRVGLRRGISRRQELLVAAAIGRRAYRPQRAGRIRSGATGPRCQEDADWDGRLPTSGSIVPPCDVFELYRNCQYSSTYVTMRDGVRLAVDVLLPPEGTCTLPVPVVLHQTRYMRGVKLRWPAKNITNGLPLDPINHAAKCFLLAAGYAVVSMDVRGTGEWAFSAHASCMAHQRSERCMRGGVQIQGPIK